MDYQQLLYFVCVAEEKTVLKAAEKLRISQPAVTRSIQNLEKELGFDLFTRERKRLILNEDGRVFLNEAYKVLASFDQLNRSMEFYQKNRDRIVIAGNVPAPLWGIRRMAKNRPEMRISTELVNDTETLIKGLKEYAYRMIILDYPYNRKGFHSEYLLKEQLHIAVSDTHPLAEKKQVAFEEIGNEVFLLMNNTGYWEDLCFSSMPRAHFVFQEEASAYSAVLHASNLITFRTDLTIRKFSRIENRVYIPVSDPAASLSYYGICRNCDIGQLREIESWMKDIPWENYRDEDDFK